MRTAAVAWRRGSPPWYYGPLESESQAVIRGMDLCGHADFARRGLEFFLKRYNEQGFLTTGYTLVGTGEHLVDARRILRPPGRSGVAEKGGADAGPRVQVDRRAAGENQAARHPRPARARVWTGSAGRDGRLESFRLSSLQRHSVLPRIAGRRASPGPRSAIPTPPRCWPTPRRTARTCSGRAAGARPAPPSSRWPTARGRRTIRRCSIVSATSRSSCPPRTATAPGATASKSACTNWRPIASSIRARDEVTQMMDYMEDHQFLRIRLVRLSRGAEPQERFLLRRLLEGAAVLLPQRRGLCPARRREAFPPLLFQRAERDAKRRKSLALGALPRQRRVEQDARNRLVPLPDRHDVRAGSRRRVVAGADGHGPLAARRHEDRGSQRPDALRPRELHDYLVGRRRPHRRRDSAADPRHAQATGDPPAASRGQTDESGHGQRQAASGFRPAQGNRQPRADGGAGDAASRNTDACDSGENDHKTSSSAAVGWRSAIATLSGAETCDALDETSHHRPLCASLLRRRPPMPPSRAWKTWRLWPSATRRSSATS